MGTFVAFICQPEVETERAVKDARLGWLPKSQIRYTFEDRDGYTWAVVPGWLAHNIGWRDDFVFVSETPDKDAHYEWACKGFNIEV